MNPDVVVDVGNTRIKWGRCACGEVAEVVSLPADAPDAWEQQRERWGLGEKTAWAVAGVHPVRRDALVRWLERRGVRAWVATSYRQLPLEVRLGQPDRVGIDRLLNAVAAVHSPLPALPPRVGEGRVGAARLPAVVVDAGSAVTVDWVDEAGAFRGGAIFPGLRLMARALHEHTALLPLIEVGTPRPYVPGLSTPQAMEAGIYYAAAGGINALVGLYRAASAAETHVYLTGGDARLLSYAVEDRAEVWPEMTLEGLRLSAEAQP
jgi:type III pantothenate kinase